MSPTSTATPVRLAGTCAHPRFLRRSTARLRSDLHAAVRSECECDGYVGFTCGKHCRVEEIAEALRARGAVEVGRLG